MSSRKRNSKGRYTKRAKSAKRKSSRRRRRNGAGLGRAGFAAARAAATPKRKKARKSRKRSATRRVRPTILVNTRGRFSRPRRSKYFKRPTMINGRRRKSRRNGGTSIMATIKRTLTVKTMTNYLSLGGGILAGSMLAKMLVTGAVPFMPTVALPASVMETLSHKNVRPFHGIINVVVGSIIAAKCKNKYLRDAGIGLAAFGGYDLVSQALNAMGVSGLATLAGANVDYLNRTSYSGMNVNLLGGGMNVDLMGDANSYDAESNHLADNINDMIS